MININLPLILHYFTPFGTLAIQVKFYGDRPRGTPPLGELNTRGVAECTDFGPIERSRKRCKIEAKLILITKSHELSIGNKLGNLG